MVHYTMQMFNELGLLRRFSMDLQQLEMLIISVFTSSTSNAVYHGSTKAFATAHAAFIFATNLADTVQLSDVRAPPFPRRAEDGWRGE
jgi:hypothetical protein